MNRTENIGRGAEDERPNHPYEVGVHWEDSGVRPIALGEGSGWSSAGGSFALCDVTHDKWTRHLEICGCLWLRDLAREEAARQTLFTADEIWQRAQERAAT